MFLKNEKVAVISRRRNRPVLLGAGAVFAALLALYACGTSPESESRAAIVNPAAVVSSPAPAVTAATPAAATSKMFGADARPLARVPKDNPRKGLVYRGLTVAKKGLCVGGYQLADKGRARCTHGPDEPPADVSVKLAASPASTAATTAAAATGLPVCEGDGTTGKRVEVLYVHGATSQYDKYRDTFRLRAEQVDDIYYQSALETGGVRHVRYVTEQVDGVCRAVVRDVQIADSALGDFDTARDAVIKAGYPARDDRKYLMFVDTNVYCGIGEFLGDTTKSDANRSNGGGYARVDNGCWQYPDVASHELGHNLGAVNDDAPNASHHAHCTDEYDVMCYQDADDTVLHTACPDQAHDMRLDCNHDDYYNTDPSPGTYLAKEYNVADNLFLIKGTPATGSSTSPSASPSPSPSPSLSPSPSPSPSTSTSPSASVSPSPSTGTDPATLLVGKQSSRCLDTTGAGVANLTQTVLFDCTGSATQKWTYTAGRELKLAAGKCLDAYGQSTVAGTKVIVYTCNGQANQQWTVRADGTVAGVQSGLCLDAAGQGTANGTMVLLWTCNGQANQQWSRG